MSVRSVAQELTVIADQLEEEGHHVVRLLLGQPYSGAPKEAIDYMAKVAESDVLGYTSALGIRPLREQIAKLYQERYSLTISYQQVVVTIGASMGLIILLVHYFKRGDKIAIPYPAYPAQKSTMELLGYQPVGIYTKRENNFQLRVSDLEALDEPIDGLLISSPSNPTGAMIEEAELERLVAYCHQHNIRLLSDEIYHGMVYPGSPNAQTVLAYDPNGVVINSFSKYYSMPGWRIGWLIMPESEVNDVGSAMRNLYLSTAAPSQYAALKAMQMPEVAEQHVVTYAKNREVMREGLEQAGFTDYIEPQGAFYYYVNIKHTGLSAEQFAVQFLNQCHVAVMPGEPFDPKRGHDWIRLSYAARTEDVKHGMQQLQKFSW